MSEALFRRIITSAHRAIIAHADELTALDQAIGDGDHGVNMKRGFDAIADVADEIAVLPFGKALQKAGMTLVMKVGGASGPLYGSLLMAMGKSRQDMPASLDEVIEVLGEGIDAVKARGKSDAGAKTMLDVLVPVHAALMAGGGDPIAIAREAAETALGETRDMLATKGRASFLGERSIGHLDPGARSTTLLINVLCDELETS